MVGGGVCGHTVKQFVGVLVAQVLVRQRQRVLVAVCDVKFADSSYFLWVTTPCG